MAALAMPIVLKTLRMRVSRASAPIAIAGWVSLGGRGGTPGWGHYPHTPALNRLHGCYIQHGFRSARSCRSQMTLAAKFLRSSAQWGSPTEQ